MNQDLQIFSYEGNELGTMIDEKEEIWFVAADACKILGIKNVSDAVEKLEEDEKLLSPRTIAGQQRNVLWISEPGFYRLIFRSDKPDAKKIQYWTFHEVLPAIRKTGSYSQAHPLQGELGMPTDHTALSQLIRDKEAEIRYKQAELTFLREYRRYLGRKQYTLTKESQEIITALQHQGKPLYPRDLVKMLGLPEGTIRVRLFKMKHRGEVRDTGEGYISLIPQSEPE